MDVERGAAVHTKREEDFCVFSLKLLGDLERIKCYHRDYSGVRMLLYVNYVPIYNPFTGKNRK